MSEMVPVHPTFLRQTVERAEKAEARVAELEKHLSDAASRIERLALELGRATASVSAPLVRKPGVCTCDYGLGFVDADPSCPVHVVKSEQRTGEAVPEPDHRGSEEIRRLGKMLVARLGLEHDPLALEVTIIPRLVDAYAKGVEIGADYAKRQARSETAIYEAVAVHFETEAALHAEGSFEREVLNSMAWRTRKLGTPTGGTER